MNEWLLAALWHNRLWYSMPLIVAVSLVYAATRHELMGPIIQHAIRFATWIVVFMIAIFGVLLIMSWML